MKILIGLTGKSGSGKTAAAKIFTSLGAFVADCDTIAHSLLRDDEIKKELCRNFSENILTQDNEIDRKVLGKAVFGNAEKLETLNKILHGAIVERALSQCKNSGKDICFIDGSELEKSGADKLCARVVVICADEDVRLARITARDGIDKESALLRLHSQKDYGGNAVFIQNNGSFKEFEAAVTEFYNKLSGEINV